jgi:hypothetical protein
MPEKTWRQFTVALDQHIRRIIGQYAAERTVRVPPCQFLAGWDQVHSWVAAAQRLTLDSRHPGESDLDVLMRNLAKAADPAPPESAWFGWAVGYHATEAATALAAGFEGTAGSHRSVISEMRSDNQLGKELTTGVFDPGK